MQLNKSQVKAFLEVMGSDETRHIICTAKIDKYNDHTVVVATNGYVLAALSAPGLAGHEGKHIDRASIIKWYKLATPRDQLDESAIIEMLSETKTEGKYPDWQLLIRQPPAEAVEKVSLNANYMLTMQKLSGNVVTYTARGKLGPMISETDGNVYLVMPIKFS